LSIKCYCLFYWSIKFLTKGKIFRKFVILKNKKFNVISKNVSKT
jgi:hypothetical protein